MVPGFSGRRYRHGMTAFLDVLLGGLFHAAVLFLVAAGLQLVFGVQKIVNLACGSFYAFGAYFGIFCTAWAVSAGLPPWLFLPVLLLAGAALAVIGPPIELMLRAVYDRDESFQLLLTFAFVLMFQDALRFLWGSTPQQLGNLYMVYGTVAAAGVVVPTYNLLVIAASLTIACAPPPRIAT
jgi:branched-chain amino acid transport system permease protein